MATDVKAQDPTRKVFNCIVDDSALAAGLKKGTRDGIRKWVSSGVMRLFVPLHALEHLNRVKVANDRIGADARDALTWLDEVTSLPNPAVHLQEPDQEYETWEEVEKHLLPATLLSEEDLEEESELLSAELERSLELEDTPDEASDHISLSSNGSVEARQQSSPKSMTSKNGHNRSDTSLTESMRKGTRDRSRSTKRDSLSKSPNYNPKGIATAALRPLFNHAVWLINREPDSEAALASFIFLTNDITKQTIGRKFGLRAKRLDELRSIIVREEKDLKNRAQFFKKESKGLYAPPMASAPKVVAPVTRAEEKPDTSEVLFKRGSRGSMGSNGQQVLDPNEFTRTPPPKGTRGAAARGGRGSGRGNPRALFPGSPPQKAARPAIIDPARPIDPDSFSRPSLAGRPVVGGKRRLWEPS